MNFGDIALLGIDVGFSKSCPTTGIAWSANGTFGAAKTYTDWDRRRRHLPAATTYSVIAIDGPLVPTGSPDLLVRLCEQTLARGEFQKRCKPGSSHFGTGLQLKRAALETAEQIKHLTSAPMFAKAVFGDVAIVEAFPNAFLGVLMPEETFGTFQILRGKKFDWMYEHVVEAGRLTQLMAFVGWDAPELLRRMQTERDHEKRAAYICLLTAACAAAGKAEVIGDVASGWIWLKPVNGSIAPHLGHRGSRCCCPNAAIARAAIRSSTAIRTKPTRRAVAQGCGPRLLQTFLIALVAVHRRGVTKKCRAFPTGRVRPEALGEMGRYR